MPSHFRLGDLAFRPSQDSFTSRDRSWDRKFLPRIYTDPKGFERVFELAVSEGMAGLDLEYGSGGRPTILGIASRDECAAIPWDVYWARRIASSRIPLVGHAVTTADRPVLDAAAEIVTPLTQWEDTMVLFYLLYADTCRAAGKEDDTDDASTGMLGLWTMASIYTRLWNWKKHRGDGCEGPCPRCKPFEYCAVDSWAGLAAFEPMKREYLALGCSWDLYRAIIRRTDFAYRMTRRGVKVDRAYIAGLDGEFEKYKASLYPYDLTAKGKKKYLTPGDFEGSLFADAIDTASLCRYNPASPKQIIEWFDQRGVSLKDVASATILHKLESVCGKYGVPYEIDKGVLHVEDDETWQPPNEVVGELYKLHHWKSGGKGVNAWFDDKYFDATGLIHPRWITTGTAFGRWSSSKPNFQNIPSRGFGALIKRGIIPRLPGYQILKGDASQLELRRFLHAANVVPPAGDIFSEFLAGPAGPLFLEASKATPMKPRDVAKQTSHACLDADHSVLTPGGWVGIADVAQTTPVAIWHEGGRITFELPSKVHRYDAPDVMIRIRGRGCQSLATENHEYPIASRMAWRTKKYTKLYKLPIDKFPQRGAIPVAGILANSDYPIQDDDIRRCVAIQADGSKQGKAWRFGFTKLRKVRRMEMLFGVKPSFSGRKHRFYVVYQADLLTETKEFDWDKCLALSARQRKIFLDEVLLWDGCVEFAKTCRTYTNTNLQSIQVVQTLAHLTGSQALFRLNDRVRKPQHKQQYRVSFNQRQYAAGKALEISRSVATTPHVYCLTVSTGFFLTKFHGTISVTGNSDYGEGLQILTGSDLASTRIIKEETAGARLIFRDWEFRGGVVSFTGANLAQRLFGNKTLDSRRRALGIQEIYFSAPPFDQIRRLQKELGQQLESRGGILTEAGRFYRFYGAPEDDLKGAWAGLGQGSGADYIQGVMEYFDADGDVPILQVHDELVFEVPAEWNNRRCYDFMERMTRETPYIPGFACPAKFARGTTWKDAVEITLETVDNK